MRFGFAAFLGMFVGLALSSETALGQVPPPPPASPTIWSFLGIPQGAYKVHAQLFNRRGNFPKLEKKPPLKAIADVENLKSEVPAIKAAAEIKQQEDLKPQKIKAIKYLATIGCGCYDKEKKVTKALLAAMDDCTEEVRLAAMHAVAEAAAGGNCDHCNQRNCCNEEIVNQLSKVAYQRDDEGCFVEPSERVREAAIEALCVCCPGPPPQPAPTEAPVPVEGSERPTPVEGSDRDAPPAPPPPVLDTTAWQPSESGHPMRSRPRATRTQLTSNRRIQPTAGVLARGEVDAEVVTTPVHRPAQVVTPAEHHQMITGHVDTIRPETGAVRFHLHHNATLPIGAMVKVLHRFPNGLQSSATFEVTGSEPGWANARSRGDVRVSRIAPGDEIVAWH